jgi:hypothetical protein
LPGSAARIIVQNFASCRLASSFNILFLVFNPFTSFPQELAWVKMGCGILEVNIFLRDNITSKNTKMVRKVNKANPVFCEKKGCSLLFP